MIGSVLGSLLLLLRKALAVPVFALAILGMIVSFGYQFMAETRPSYTGLMWAMTVLIWAIAIFELWFARLAKAKSWIA